MRTLASIRKGWLEPALRIAERLLDDPHDLIHKATGWVLREIGRKDEAVLTDFLDKFSQHMSKTALRYARERLGGKG